MSVETQIERIKTNISNAYASAEAKGATIPEVKNSENLASCVDSISSGGGGATLFGLTLEELSGYIDENGEMKYLTPCRVPDFSGLKTIGAQLGRGSFVKRFNGFDFVENTDIVFPDLEKINGIEECFYNSKNIRSFTFSKATICFTATSAMWAISTLETVSFPELISCNSYGFNSMLTNCVKLKDFNVPKLQSIDSNGFSSCFSGCISLENISFPSLTTVKTNSFGESYAYAFNGCTKLLEIHFRADAQAAIEAMTGYADKWGATNATIYFDL